MKNIELLNSLSSYHQYLILKIESERLRKGNLERLMPKPGAWLKYRKWVQNYSMVFVKGCHIGIYISNIHFQIFWNITNWQRCFGCIWGRIWWLRVEKKSRGRKNLPNSYNEGTFLMTPSECAFFNFIEIKYLNYLTLVDRLSLCMHNISSTKATESNLPFFFSVKYMFSYMYIGHYKTPTYIGAI